MKNTKGNLLRRIFQLSVIALMIIVLSEILGNTKSDPESFCPFGGAQAFTSYLVNGNMACAMTMMQIVMSAALVLAIILFSKLFCSYLCPIGLVTEYLDKARVALKIKTFEIKTGSILDRILRITKYLLLFIIFYYSVSSSELFCKKFDPYYAIATGLDGEISVWMTLTSIYLLVFGGFFIKMFWCKYICPLGAMSNIFKYIVVVAIVAGTYVGLNLFGVQIHWLYILGALLTISYLLEIIFLKSRYAPFFKITRDENTCTNCNECDKSCPYSIKISESKRVDHIDCNLCGDCINSCSQKALSINRSKKFKFLPPIVIVLFFAAAMYIGSIWELPMLTDMWADETKIEKLKEHEIRGLRSINCYGTSKVFAEQLREIHGIYGVQTFTEHQKVKIFYDPNEISKDEIEESIYTPAKFKISNPPKDVEKIKIITVRAENMYDRMDPNYFGIQLRLTERGYYGLETEFAHPLIIRLFLDINEPIDERFIKEILEMRELQMPVHGGKTKKIDVDFKFISLEAKVDTISRREFMVRQFKAYSSRYKDNNEKWGTKDEAIYELEMPGLDKPVLAKTIPFLSSYLSLNDGFLGINTYMREDDMPCIQIFFSKKALNEEQIWKVLTREDWKIKQKNGVYKMIPAKIMFEDKGILK